MAETTKKVDALGFDKFQIANIKRAYAANKVTYRKMDSLASKIKDLHEQYQAHLAETESFESAVKAITQKVLGIDLTSREVLAYHENPQLFAQNHPEHPLFATLVPTSGESVQEGTDTCVDVPQAEITDQTGEAGVDPFNM